MNNGIEKHIHTLVSALPNSPGVYQFLDSDGNVIYVGKAKSLKKRVSSYFVDSRNHSAKVRALVKRVADIHHIVVNTEHDALLLENSLIKRLQPRYNILLKDDKTYPWITITNELFPRVLQTRTLTRDGSEYFGPYGSISLMRELLDFVHDIMPLRICTRRLTRENTTNGYHKPCLQYHLHRCKAPCAGLQSVEEYNEYIAQVRAILKGDLRPLRKQLTTEMELAASELRFEDAARHLSRIKELERYQSMSVIVSSKIVDCDVFSIIKDERVAYCNALRVRQGSIVVFDNIRIPISATATEEEALSKAICKFVERFEEPLASDVIVPFIPTVAAIFDKIKFITPKIGEKANLLSFSQKSVTSYRKERLEAMARHNPERATNRLMEEIKRELGLKHEPRHMECFDNSNLQGTNPVAACVVFRDGKPSRKEYRHFNIKSVEGPNDYASMHEVVTRRYRRMIEEGRELPNLIIIDGGKGQLSIACQALKELNIYDSVEIISLAERLEEVFFPNDPYPLYLSRTGAPLKTICHIRDEAHRFGITFHRDKRSAAMKGSKLNEIKGIGEQTRALLLKHFRTISAIERADLEGLSKIIGPAKAKKIHDYFTNKQ